MSPSQSIRHGVMLSCVFAGFALLMFGGGLAVVGASAAHHQGLHRADFQDAVGAAAIGVGLSGIGMAVALWSWYQIRARRHL